MSAVGVQRLRTLPEDVRVAAASVIVSGHVSPEIDVMEALDVLSEVAAGFDCDPGRRAHILDVASSLGLRGVERLCLVVSDVSVAPGDASSRDNLRRVISEVSTRLKEEAEYPGYLERLSNLSAEHIVAECDRTGSIRYASDLMYGYGPIMRHVSDLRLKSRLLQIQDALAFS